MQTGVRGRRILALCTFAPCSPRTAHCLTRYHRHPLPRLSPPCQADSLCPASRYPPILFFLRLPRRPVPHLGHVHRPVPQDAHRRRQPARLTRPLLAKRPVRPGLAARRHAPPVELPKGKVRPVLLRAQEQPVLLRCRFRHVEGAAPDRVWLGGREGVLVGSADQGGGAGECNGGGGKKMGVDP